MTSSVPPLAFYPATCNFPGCELPAPLAPGEGVSLCAEHERLRFYTPDEFERRWEVLNPEP
jgi:hypothetical protein